MGGFLQKNLCCEFSLCPREGWDPLPFNSKPDDRDHTGEEGLGREALERDDIEPQGEDCEIPASCFKS